MKRNIYLALLALLFLSACDPQSPDSGERAVYDIPATHEGNARFTIASHGSFLAGEGNSKRELLIITDTFTQNKYFGITGVGVTEMRTELTATVDANGNSTVTSEVRER